MVIGPKVPAGGALVDQPSGPGAIDLDGRESASENRRVGNRRGRSQPGLYGKCAWNVQTTLIRNGNILTAAGASRGIGAANQRAGYRMHRRISAISGCPEAAAVARQIENGSCHTITEPIVRDRTIGEDGRRIVCGRDRCDAEERKAKCAPSERGKGDLHKMIEWIEF